MAETAQSVITDALTELGVVAQGEIAAAGDLAWGLKKANRLLDSWNAESLQVFSYAFSTYTLTPNLSPHTIGPATNSPVPTFKCTGQRPVRIPAINLVINNVSPNYQIPLNPQDKDWWAAQSVQALATSYPTDYYYEPDWPNGSIFFWPVPTAAWPVQIEAYTALLQFAALSTVFSLPPAYWDMLVYNLAVTMGPSFGKPPDPVLVALATKSIAKVKSLNATSPRISTGGDGLSSSRRRSSFNWRTGFST